VLRAAQFRYKLRPFSAAWRSFHAKGASSILQTLTFGLFLLHVVSEDLANPTVSEVD
jgi:hypothetical protein